MQAPDLSFLQVRLMSIGTALFFCEDDATLPFPAYMITALKTDEEGNVWFLISRSWNRTVTYNMEFPANLDFYRKGYPYSIAVKGQACLINDQEIMQGFMQELLGKSMQVKEDLMETVLLVKVRIESATCKELMPKKTGSAFRDMMTSMKNWMFPANTQLQPSL